MTSEEMEDALNGLEAATSPRFRDNLMRLQGERDMLERLIPIANQISERFNYRADAEDIATAAKGLFNDHGELLTLLGGEAQRIRTAWQIALVELRKPAVGSLQ